MPRWLQSATAFGLYLTVSICYFGLSVLANPLGRFVGLGGDPSIQAWDLVWWPHAIRNGLNPFLTRKIWAPGGFNLAWMVGMPGPALALSPLTQTLGPVITYNVLCLLAPALAAWCGYMLCRYVTRSFWPSLFGGYIFGFSSYVLGHMLGHVFLVLIFPVPLAVLLVLLKLDEKIAAPTFVLLLTAVLTFEFLSSTELFASTAAMGALVAAIAIATLPLDRQAALRSTLLLGALAYCGTAIVVSPYLYYVLVDGEPPPINSATAFSTVLLNFIVPTSMTFLGGALLTPLSKHFSGNVSEAGAYSGLPLLLIVWLLYARAHWRTPVGKLLLLSLLAIGLASLGPRLHIAGLATIPLPWMIASLLPLIDQALPVRFSAYLFLIEGIIGALYLSDTGVRRSLRITLGMLSVLSLLPNPWFSHSRSSAVAEPAFFSSGIYKRYIARNEIVLILPFEYATNCMLWQAQTDMYFRMAGGYTGLRPTHYLRWATVLRSLNRGEAYPGYSAQLKPFLAVNQVDAIIVATSAPSDRDAACRLLVPLGVTPIEVADVLLYVIPNSSLAVFRASSPVRFEAQINLVRYSEMIRAAQEYTARALPWDQLSRKRVEQLGLPPQGSSPPASGRRATPQPGYWGEDALIMPQGGDRIVIGITAFYDTAEPIVRKYRQCSSEIYFPKHTKLSRRPSPDAYGELRIKFDRAGLECAAKLAAPPRVAVAAPNPPGAIPRVASR